ncbi:ribonuclease P protein component [Branchiibius hedensis]|uniref:Ribonuclease P protein component n=2 Tax=Branchiibius hedensis TaxID=672460 RepID=A0A2Y9BUJ1_9MICO|nr:ribonuclease P protein component [Branchiibius hedensis]SSA35802.1 ribonuclease P protein component [Branchiibius hedensis]
MVVVQMRTHSMTDPGPTRVGFVVSKAVGDAVTRNRVKRILRHAVAARLAAVGDGQDIVIRALPAASAAVSELGSRRLRAELDTLLDRLCDTSHAPSSALVAP